MAHVLLHRDHIPRIVLSRQFDIGYCSDVVRRVAEESRRRRGGRGRSDQGGLTVDVTQRTPVFLKLCVAGQTFQNHFNMIAIYTINT